MNISLLARATVIVFIPLLILNSCHRRRTNGELRSHGKDQIVGGSITAAVAAGSTAAGIATLATLGTGWVAVGQLLSVFIVWLPIIVVTTPIAIALITKGISDRKKAEKLRLLEQTALFDSRLTPSMETAEYDACDIKITLN